jgi:hypothetical protein
MSTKPQMTTRYRRASISREHYRAIYRMTAIRLRDAPLELAASYVAVDADHQKMRIMHGIATIDGMLHEIQVLRF